MNHPEIAILLGEAACCITLYENYKKDLAAENKLLNGNMNPLGKSIVRTKIGWLENCMADHLRNYHNAMDKIQSLNALIPVP